MPLHLLGKKSWNVYNAENVARVKRDEAQAQAREEENDRLMQEEDAERRIKLLRGEPASPPPPPSRPSDLETLSTRHTSDDIRKPYKRRRVAGENDTDRDIRYAREDAAQATAKRDELVRASRKSGTAEAPILDSAGHINLFPSADTKSEKNPEAEAEAARKKRSYEDQYTMRFSNAAGFKETIGQKPWYSAADKEAMAPGSTAEKDVWGNADPRRKERSQARMSANDPLAAMKRGVRQLKTSEQERKRWNEERRRELDALKTDEVKRSSHRRARSPSVDSLDGFRLDGPPRESEKVRKSSGGHERRHRDRSRDRSHRHRRERSRESHRRRSEGHHPSRHGHRSRHSEPSSNYRRSSNSTAKTRD
ncbi:unnamed protein product [Penicillium salamii]|nr:unnamed protein product [Penicillium salamii]